jgi:hypothetical protein
MFDDSRQRELRAAAIRASIEHPNLLPARLVRGRKGQDARLVLKKSSAPRLDEVLASRQLGPRDCLQILYDVACAVDALTQHGLVASELVPSRILVDAKRGGILADPGIPAELSRRPPREDDQEAVYRSPEERAGRPIDVRSNIYSLGVILSTALTGGPPTELRDAPTAMDAVIAWATDVNPAHRYSSPEELMFAAADALAAPEAPRRKDSRRARPASLTRRTDSAKPRSSSATASAPPKRAEPAEAGPVGDKDKERDKDKPRRRLLTVPRVLLAGAVLASALTGILLGRSGTEEPQQSRIASSALTLRLAPGWVETGVGGDAGSLLSDAVAAAPADEDGVRIVAGRVENPVAAARLLGAEGGAPPAGARLGRLETWRYTQLRLGPKLVATGYLAPTTGDPLLVICRAQAPKAGALLPACERIASTITLRGESGVPLSAIEAREKRFQRVMTSLVRDRVAARRRLARERLASQQADAARRLERIYRRAAAGVAEMPSGPGRPAHEGLARSLGATADAYGRLARAAEAVDRSRYRVAIGVVRESEAAVLREAAEPRPV